MAAAGPSYKELLTPIKDLEKSFTVDISMLLQCFIAELLDGNTIPNFNSAALLIQGSSSIYCKKVEYLFNLAVQLHNNLTKQKKDDQQQAQKKEKEKTKKEDKFNDPFLSVEFKMGKNLSCLRKKNLAKSTTKKPAPKKAKPVCVPVNILSTDKEDKGEVFYDTRGVVIGNTGDFALNKCRLMSSGWLLLPTVNPNLIPPFEAINESFEDQNLDEPNVENIGDEITDALNDVLQSSPDEGLGSLPSSNVVSQATPATAEIGSVDVLSSAPLSQDEGIGDTPNDDIDPPSPGNEGDENIPTELGENANPPAPQPVRQSVRRALKTCQLAVEDDPLAGITIDKELLVRKKIQKKNTRCLPDRLKMNDNELLETEECICSISDYCARTFFSMDGKFLKNSLMNFDVESFDQNSKFMRRIMNKISTLKLANRKKSIEPIEDEKEIDVEGIETLQDANDDDDSLCIPFDDNDIEIDNDPGVRSSEQPQSSQPPPPPTVDSDMVPEMPASDMPSPDISHIAHEECENYLREVHQFVQNSDITQRVQEWEMSVKPFLDEVEKRESFDINLYGSRILNAFEDSNRKQTMTFKNFCKGKQKWEIHRYFMALLPLANVGNVSIESELKEDETEEIFVTLLSRKMHHKELEEFGHGEGSHS